MRHLGFRVVVVGVVTTVVGYSYGTVCTSWVVAPTGNACLQLGNGVSGFVYAAGFGVAILGLIAMIMRGEFAGALGGRAENAEPEEVVTASRPNCPSCGEPLVRIVEHERWYCLKCKDFR